MKKMISDHLLLQTLFLMTVCISYAQFDGNYTGNIFSTGFSFDDFNSTWKPDKNDLNNHSIKIKKLGINFSKIKFKNTIDSELYSAQIEFSGPEISLEKFSYSSEILSSNWITNEKIKRLEKRQSIPKKTILILANAIDLYLVDNAALPSSLNDLHISKHINLDLPPFDDYSWSYMLNLPESIIAYTTHINPIHKSKKIQYNFNTKSFQNSAETDSLYNVPQVQWNYLLGIDNISTSFFTKLILDIDSTLTNFSLNMKRGKFKLNETSFTATPFQDLTNQAYINLPQLLIDAHDITLDGSFNKRPTIHSGKGKFFIRNFEIKIPEGLSREPEIEYFLETLGIWNNLLIVRLVQLELNMINELTGDFTIKIHTPFIKIDCSGDFSLRQNNSLNDLALHNTEIKVNPISFGVRKWIKKWETDNKKELQRQGATILLKLKGTLEDPIIEGF